MAKKEFYADGSGDSGTADHCSYATRLLRARAMLNRAMDTPNLPGPVRVSLLKGYQPALAGVNLISDCVRCVLPDESTAASDINARANWIGPTGEARICPNARTLQTLSQKVIDARFFEPQSPPPPRNNGSAI